MLKQCQRVDRKTVGEASLLALEAGAGAMVCRLFQLCSGRNKGLLTSSWMDPIGFHMTNISWFASHAM